MMPIVVVDTDVVICLISTPRNDDERSRQGYTRLAFENLQKQKARIVIPTPVIAELCRDGSGSDVLRQSIRPALSHLRLEVLDEDAADIAGRMCIQALRSKPSDKPRAAVKYDALIAAIAHQVGARWLATANADDMRPLLATINSPVQILDTTKPPETGQLPILAVLGDGRRTRS